MELEGLVTEFNSAGIARGIDPLEGVRHLTSVDGWPAAMWAGYY